jgi:hypothetical protein
VSLRKPADFTAREESTTQKQNSVVLGGPTVEGGAPFSDPPSWRRPYMLREHGGRAGPETPRPRLGGGFVNLEEFQKGARVSEVSPRASLRMGDA